MIDVVDKAILLLDRGADISCRAESGDTVLHTILKSKRLYEYHSETEAPRHKWLHDWYLSFKAPKDLLMVFITAGADVYATNDDGITPFMIASENGREYEWIETLEACGYQSEEVLRACILHPTREHQTPKLSFQEYCQQRQYLQHSNRFEHVRIEHIHNHSQYIDKDEYANFQGENITDSQYADPDAYVEENHEEIKVSTDDTEYFRGSGGNMEIFGGVEHADYGMDIGLSNEGKKYAYNAEEMLDHQFL